MKPITNAPLNALQLKNQSHDVAIAVEGDDSEVSSNDEPTPKGRKHGGDTPPQLRHAEEHAEYGEGDEGYSHIPNRSTSPQSDASEEQQSPAGRSKLEYNPADYAGLKVGKDIKDLFQFITAFKPQSTDPEARIKPFIPDYLPAVGDIDTFVKIPRPDNKADNLGLTMLDEPGPVQSSPAAVKLALGYLGKTKNSKKASDFVDNIEEARHKPQRIDKWIQDIQDIHRKRPSVNVHYKHAMPDIEPLLQLWPGDFEDLLSRPDIEMPPAKIDLELYQYVQLICNILDIPVYDNIIDSLHLLFTLYSEFNANQHFQSHV